MHTRITWTVQEKKGLAAEIADMLPLKLGPYTKVAILNAARKAQESILPRWRWRSLKSYNNIMCIHPHLLEAWMYQTANCSAKQPDKQPAKQPDKKSRRVRVQWTSREKSLLAKEICRVIPLTKVPCERLDILRAARDAQLTALPGARRRILRTFGNIACLLDGIEDEWTRQENEQADVSCSAPDGSSDIGFDLSQASLSDQFLDAVAEKIAVRVFEFIESGYLNSPAGADTARR